MLLVREIMYCKPGKVRPMVEKSLAFTFEGRFITGFTQLPAAQTSP